MTERQAALQRVHRAMVRDSFGVQDGRHYAELSPLAHVSLSRVGPIMNLLLFAPDIEEAILFLPRTDGRRAPIRERHVRPICAVTD